MRLPCCTVCENRYNEDERCPLLLQCGHGFCKDCLSKMFSASLETTLSCPRCRHVSTIGNSVTALKKNYAILALINDSSASATAASNYFSEEEEDDEDDDGMDERGRKLFSFGTNNTNYSSYNHDDEVDDEVAAARRRRRGAQAATSCGSGRIEVGMHQGLKLVRRIEGDGNRSNVVSTSRRSAVVETWAAVMVGSNGKCRHKVAVKKVAVGEEMDIVWVQGKLDGLRKASMWCRNVCAFHGATRMEDGSLGLVMDRCKGSVQTEMQRNEGRLTLEQILR